MEENLETIEESKAYAYLPLADHFLNCGILRLVPGGPESARIRLFSSFRAHARSSGCEDFGRVVTALARGAPDFTGRLLETFDIGSTVMNRPAGCNIGDRKFSRRLWIGPRARIEDQNERDSSKATVFPEAQPPAINRSVCRLPLLAISRSSRCCA